MQSDRKRFAKSVEDVAGKACLLLLAVYLAFAALRIIFGGSATAVAVLEDRVVSMDSMGPTSKDMAVAAITRSAGRCLIQITGLLVFMATLGTDVVQRCALMSVTWWTWILEPATFVFYPLNTEAFMGGYLDVGAHRYVVFLGGLAWAGHGLLHEKNLLHETSETALPTGAGAKRLAKGLRVHGIIGAVTSATGILTAWSIPDLANQPMDVARPLANIFANVEVLSMLMGCLMIAVGEYGTLRLQRAAGLWTLVNMWILLPLLYLFYPTASGGFFIGMPPALLVALSVHSVPLVWGLLSQGVFSTPLVWGLALP